MYRPIYLLDEGKIFERIIASRFVEYLKQMTPDLADYQFEFREGRLTVDAIMHLKVFSDQATTQSGMALAVSLDIANAFNTLLWEELGRRDITECLPF